MIRHICGKANTKLSQVYDNQIQPNAVELTVGAVRKCVSGGTFVLRDNLKQHIEKEEFKPVYEETNDKVYLLEEGVYEIEFEQRVQMGADEVGIVISRSSLMRNGIWMTSALYDSGYVGKMVASLQVPKGTRFEFPKGERLAQFVIFEAEALKRYTGSYQEAVL